MAPPTDFLENSMGSRLLSLPAELRNIIYELTFTTDYDDDEKIRHSRTSRHIDLITTKPPSKMLLCTCRQIYDEAHLIHRTQYRKFWSSGKFLLDLGPARSDNGYTVRLRPDVDHVNSLQIEYMAMGFIMFDKRGH
ncbi:hypothetical protein CLAFUW4_10788 [Fulvia fulva]|uniref:F-box domain-containing protein n=1 Tax=Passalora fulva TaxID=5499 RepID=A0A9Q8PDB2_PASFU|nr:uncharacterized protein CLAFUR5_09831 [Fulvia fulva]KAK4619479.1 hypothetical protein CLAFUR4_10793 [Fulvia fulva]KAK4620952.1 hypothetical protein CLAFUR0_10800 [Fulvia fulva]UJO20340.1 hypothetical protein CLAFUR5_09831 [Fulvia fulva]WPV17609.1 hypothetical protein CLAFUW4_10788 [Fulvia fulva]WPV32709.1 hypothetical protein CLAFUW7_10786 [Fulvia fulva]